jgi:TetR/AcrR family transcriptional regulator, regulator of autoinduction and epiphytic fitness
LSTSASRRTDGDHPKVVPALRKEDGRAVRSATTRRAVAEAYLNLLNGGDMRPTARSIAAEAGVSERAVFRHFQDMETLHSEAAALQIQRVGRDLPGPASATGPVEDRARVVARRWCTLNERVTPVRRVALLHEPFCEEIARRLAWVRSLARTELEKTFAAEIESACEARRPHLIAAVSATASWETWNELRTRHGLDEQAALETVTTMMLAILTAMPAS